MSRGPYNTQSKIRLRSKHVFFTYPRCDLPLQDILDQLVSAFASIDIKLSNYIICHELHKDGFPHRHAWLQLSRATESIKPSTFYLTAGDHTYKGDFEDQKFSAKCAKYTTKSEDYITSFTPNQLEKLLNQANESVKMDMGHIAQELMNGRPIEELLLIWPALFWKIKEIKENLRHYKKLMHKPRDLEPGMLKCIWKWGPTGSGKSRSTKEEYPSAYIKNHEMFWGGYEYQNVVVLQDVDSSWGMTLYCFKEWCDLYPFNAKVKHDPEENMIRPDTMIVTSQYTIRECYERMFKQFQYAHDEELITALERRFTQKRFDKPAILPEVFPNNYFAEPSDKDEFCMFCNFHNCVCFKENSPFPF